MIRIIAEKEITKFNTVITYTVPEESYLLTTAAIHEKPTLYFVQPSDPIKDEEGNVPTIDINVLAIHGAERWSDVVGEGMQLSYIGASVWDSGYRICHVFEIIEEEENLTEEEFYQLVEGLKEEQCEKDEAEELEEPIINKDKE